MGHFYLFEKLEVWQNARSLSNSVFAIIESFPASYNNLANQLQQSAVSILVSIGESVSKENRNEKIDLMQKAYSKAIELYNLTVLSKDLGLISEEIQLDLRNRINRICDQINYFKKYWTSF